MCRMTGGSEPAHRNPSTAERPWNTQQPNTTPSGWTSSVKKKTNNFQPAELVLTFLVYILNDLQPLCKHTNVTPCPPSPLEAVLFCFEWCKAPPSSCSIIIVSVSSHKEWEDFTFQLETLQAKLHSEPLTDSAALFHHQFISQQQLCCYNMSVNLHITSCEQTAPVPIR